MAFRKCSCIYEVLPLQTRYSLARFEWLAERHSLSERCAAKPLLIMKSRIVWLLLCCIWGSTWLFIKVGLRDLPPISFAAIRFLIAVLILAAIIALRGLALPGSAKDWWLLAGTGVLAFSL